jgi:hypothetical protein
MAQLKFNVSDELAKEFRQMVLAKCGKLEVSREGEEALKLYLEKNKRNVAESLPGSRRADSILRIIGAVKSKERHDALADLKKMESTGS